MTLTVCLFPLPPASEWIIVADYLLIGGWEKHRKSFIFDQDTKINFGQKTRLHIKPVCFSFECFTAHCKRVGVLCF